MKKSSLVYIGCFVVILVSLLMVLNSDKSVLVNGTHLSSLNEFENYCKQEYKIFEDDTFNKCVSYDYDISDLENQTFIDRLVAKVMGKNFEIPISVLVDKDLLSDLLEEYNEGVSASEDAYIDVDEDSFCVIDEVFGEQVDIDAILKIVDNVDSPISLEDYYIKPKVLSSDLKSVCGEMNRYASWRFEYEDGTVIASDISHVSYDNGAVLVDSSWIPDIVKSSLSRYDTIGVARSFTTHFGDVIEVSGGTFGRLVDYEKEIEHLVNEFESGVSETSRMPVLSRNYNDIGDTYVEVSLSAQHLWVYDSGSVIMESDIVTGTKGKSDTPKGVYYMSECINGKYLTGADYRVWVDKWMRLTNTGIGLHDASNRRAFGGSIYTRSGSHGCINLPVNFAYKLFDWSFVGCPVVIY